MTSTLLARALDTANIDSTMRLQDDFYRYVNGMWLVTHTIPVDHPMDGVLHMLCDTSEKYTRTITQDAADGTLDDLDAYRIATSWIQFLNEDTIEEAGAALLCPDLDAINTCTTHEEFACEIGCLIREGIGGLIDTYMGIDPHDSSRYMVSPVQSGIGLPDEAYYREDDHVPICEAHVAHTAHLLGPADMADPEGAAARTMGLETAIASHHRDSVNNRDPLLSDNPTPWEKIVAWVPGFDWDAQMEGVRILVAGLVMNIDQPDFLSVAATLWADTDLFMFKGWLSASVIDCHALLLSCDLVNENFDFHGRTLSGTEGPRPRWKHALGLIEAHLGEAMGRAWVAYHFPPDAKETMDTLVRRLLDAYGELIRGLDQMSEDTKVKALDKLATFSPKIGYPIKWCGCSTLHPDPEATIVESIRAANAHAIDREWVKLGCPVDHDEWYTTPQTVNAYYNLTQNEIVFPATILQPPPFDTEASDAVNFGVIGAVINHEIGHGFDDQGSHYDRAGNLPNWWTNEDRAASEERTHALIEQYDAPTPAILLEQDEESEEGDGRTLPRINGALTTGGNAGDLGGLAIAWKIWTALLVGQGLTPQSAPVIDGITGPQCFFYLWVRAWHTAVCLQSARQMLAIDPHSPAEFRCNQVLRNLDTSVEAFSVMPGDTMWLEPSQRVIIW